MSRFILSRLAVCMALVLALFSVAASAQSQDSVADAARRARERKKAAEAKPGRVITEDDVKPATPASDQPLPNSGAVPNGGSANSAKAPAPGDPKSEGESKEIADLKAQIKQTEGDLDLLQRQLSLEQDTYISNPDHARDTAGKARVDGMRQQTADKQQEVNQLKTRLLALQPTPPPPAPAPAATAPPKS